ncbi:MAG: hypothetical protein ACE5GG_00500 [Candidatus Omnitrophota bacterium]
MSLYIILFLASLGIALVLTPFIRRLSVRTGLVSFPKDDRWHKRPTAILGGVAIFFAAVIPLSFLFIFRILPLPANGARQVIALVVGSLLIFACGVIDDFRRLSPQIKILFQIITACLAVYLGVGFSFPYLTSSWGKIVDLLAVPLTIIWIIGITNAFNLLDNMDGLCAGIAAISSAMLFVCGLWGGNVLLACLALCLGAACLGFLPYNFNPAKIFMGDSGSMFLGFGLSVLALMAMSARAFSNILVTLAVPVFILAVPIFDTAFVAFIRRLNGRSILKGGKDHTSHRLVFLGLSERKAVLLLYAISVLLGLIALAYSRMNVLAVSVLAALTLVLLLFLGMFLSGVRVGEDEGVASGRGKSASGGLILNTFIFHKARIAEVILDFVLICLAYYSAYLLRFEDALLGYNAYLLKTSLPWVIIIKLGCFHYFKLYRAMRHYVGISDMVSVFKAASCGSVLSVLFVTFVYRFKEHSRVVFIIDWLLTLFLICFSRIIFRLLQEYFRKFRSGRKVLIFGAGDCGELFLREISQNRALKYKPVGFIDDDKKKKGKVIHGLPILGGREEIARQIEQKGVEEVVIAIPSLSKEDCRDVLDVCQGLGVSCRSLARIMDTERWV